MTLKELLVSSPYWDDAYCPLKPDKNGGDVLHRIGLQAIEAYWKTLPHPTQAMQFRDIFRTQLVLHHVGNGNFKRYYKATKAGDWWTKHNVMSRDQLTPIVIACGLWRFDSWLETIEKGLKSRNYFFTNTMINGKPGSSKTPDIAGPAFLALLDRAKGYPFATPAIALGDKEELAGTHLILTQTAPPKLWLPWPFNKWHFPLGGPKLHKDPVNKTLVLLFNKWTFETPDARQARILYAKKGRVWESWVRYWVRYNRARTKIIDPQCPFHLAFKEFIDTLGDD